jgi:hypothetical protein
MYVRSPGGILVECTANVPSGFYLDETPEELGRHLNLPPWYEEKREDILAMLEPITVPEANRPRPGAVRGSRPPLMPAVSATTGVPLTRTKAEFIIDPS